MHMKSMEVTVASSKITLGCIGALEMDIIMTTRFSAMMHFVLSFMRSGYFDLLKSWVSFASEPILHSGWWSASPDSHRDGHCWRTTMTLTFNLLLYNVYCLWSLRVSHDTGTSALHRVWTSYDRLFGSYGAIPVWALWGFVAWIFDFFDIKLYYHFFLLATIIVQKTIYIFLFKLARMFVWRNSSKLQK